MSETIDFSIIIPTRDRHSQLAVCLDAIANLGYPRSKFEVVVVDDGSAAPAEPVVAAYRDRLRLRLHRQEGGGPALARNCGAAVAQGRFLAFTDDDCAPAPDWLDRLAAKLLDAPERVVGGRTVNALQDDVFATASQTLIDYLYDYYNTEPGRPWFLASCNLALHAGAFGSVGGFDAAFPRAAAEDRDLCDRLRLRGYRMMYARDALVYHRHPLGLFAFMRQHFGYGRGAWRFRRARRERSGEAVRMEPVGFYAGMVVYPFRRGGIRQPFRVAALLVLSQIANFMGFLCKWGLHKLQRNGAHAQNRIG